jgi:predicted transcriptional regulator
MRNRIVGFLIIGIAALIGFIIYSFNTAMTNIVNTSCSHGSSCPMWGTIDFQTNISIAITIFVAAVGIYLIFFGEESKIITKIKKIREQVEPKKFTRANYQKIMGSMGSDEKRVFGMVVDAHGSIMQSDIVRKTGFPKVKVSRILDRLEGRGLVERRRRGMANDVVLKH